MNTIITSTEALRGIAWQPRRMGLRGWAAANKQGAPLVLPAKRNAPAPRKASSEEDVPFDGDDFLRRLREAGL